MSIRTPAAPAVLILAAFILGAGAFASADAPAPLSLSECLKRGEVSSRSLRAAALRNAEDAARADEARLMALPSLSLSGGYTRLSPVEGGTLSASTPFGTANVALPDSLEDSFSFKAAVQQPLYTGSRIRSAAAQAEALRSASLFDYERARQTLRAAVESAYWNLALASDSLPVIEENVKSVESRLADARNAFALGLAAKSETLKLESQLAGVRLLRTETENAVASARARLNLLIGLPWDAPTKVVSAPSRIEGAELPPLEDLLSRAYAKRPELGAGASRVRAAAAGLKAARSGLFPNAYLVGDATIANPNQRVFPQENKYTATWSVGVVVSLDAGRIPAVLAQSAQAQARLDQASESAALARDAVTEDLVDAYLGLVAARSRLDAASAAVSLAEESAKNAAALFDNGLALASDRGDSELQLLSARLDYAKARVGAISAGVSLSLALGGDWEKSE